MKRTTKKVSLVPLPGFLPKERILEVVRDCIRSYPKDEKKTICRAIVKEALIWAYTSPEEAIGLLTSCQQSFLQSIEDEHR